ncbi:MAG: BamA/TamA family outer membrane protein [Bacteroidales bacterium]|nr:BamA/TamA family outer membrane protein [Bacteroidales bacterium]
MIKSRLYIPLLLLLLLMVSACNTTKFVPDDKYLLKKNKLDVNERKVDDDDLESLIQQKPNNHFLGLMPVRLWAYNFRYGGNQKGLRKLIGKDYAEAPVILDKSLIRNSQEQMGIYLNNYGYFNHTISHRLDTGNQKATVHYNVNVTEPYTIRNLEYHYPKKDFKQIVNNTEQEPAIDSTMQYNAYDLDKERKRIAQALNNNGYYYFSRELVYFRVDSNLNNRKMDIDLYFQQIGDDTLFLSKAYRKYSINRVSVYPDFKPVEQTNVTYDSTAVVFDKLKRKPKYYIYTRNGRTVRPESVLNSIFIQPGEFYSLHQVNRTYNQLSNLGITRYVNIEFEEVDSTTLNCDIKISQHPRQFYSIETEGTNSGGYLGLGGSLVYKNLNFFGGAEVLRMQLNGSVEMQRSLFDEPENEFLLFNTFETGIQAAVDFPKLISPISFGRQAKYATPKSSISTGFNYQRRPYYNRTITNLSFGYEWRETRENRHILIPFEVNSVRISRSQEFTNYLDSLKDPRYTNQFTNYLITAFKYSYIFNNQQINQNTDFLYFRGNFESSGNLLHLIDNNVEPEYKDLGYNTLFNIRYAQYVKGDIDFRYYDLRSVNTRTVYRTAMGLGLPYGNSDGLPFEKGFYAGGANGLRGWRLRSLGPGSFPGSANQFDQMGEIYLEANVEYRFPLYKILHGALFADFGNIWLLEENADFPGGVFKLDSFPNQIAIDGGLGFRFDFGFFVFRIDGAIPLKDPSEPSNRKWMNPGKLNLGDIVWNFGIGQPF